MRNNIELCKGEIVETVDFFVLIVMDAEGLVPDNYPTLDNTQSVYDDKAEEFSGSTLYQYWHILGNRRNPGWSFPNEESARKFESWILKSQEWKSTFTFLNAEIMVI